MRKLFAGILVAAMITGSVPAEDLFVSDVSEVVDGSEVVEETEVEQPIERRDEQRST